MRVSSYLQGLHGLGHGSHGHAHGIRQQLIQSYSDWRTLHGALQVHGVHGAGHGLHGFGHGVQHPQAASALPTNDTHTKAMMTKSPSFFIISTPFSMK